MTKIKVVGYLFVVSLIVFVPFAMFLCPESKRAFISIQLMSYFYMVLLGYAIFGGEGKKKHPWVDAEPLDKALVILCSIVFPLECLLAYSSVSEVASWEVGSFILIVIACAFYLSHKLFRRVD